MLREVTVNKMTGPTISVKTYSSTRHRLPSSSQRLMKDNGGLDILPSLYAELQSQIAGPYASVSQKLWMISGENTRKINYLDTFSQRIDSANLSLNNTRMPLYLLTYPFVCIFQKMNARLIRPPCPAMYRKVDSPTDDHGPSYTNTNFRRSSATYDTGHSESLRFLDTPFPTILPPSMGVEAILPMSPTEYDFSAYFET